MLNGRSHKNPVELVGEVDISVERCNSLGKRSGKPMPTSIYPVLELTSGVCKVSALNLNKN